MVYELDINKVLDNEYQITDDYNFYQHKEKFIKYFKKRYLDGYMEHVCVCKKYFIFGDNEYVVCGECRNIITQEIEEFEQIINIIDVDEQGLKNNTNPSALLILFLERNNILHKKCNQSGWYIYCNKLKLGWKNSLQIINSIYQIHKHIYTDYEELNYYSSNYEYEFNSSLGSSSYKFKKSIDYCIGLFPNIFNNYVSTYTYKLLK